MAHLKRHKTPKNWPIARKGTTFVVRPNFSIEKGLPILIILRDLLKVAQNRKEVKKAIHQKNILVNNKIARDEKNGLVLFDTITLVPSKKHYHLTLSDKGKLALEEIKESESNKKVSKVINKKTLKGKKTQLNLGDGMNFISDIKCNVNDSVIIDLKNRKIEKCLPLKEKANVIVFEGKHTGEKGTITKIISGKKMAELIVNKKPVNVLIKQMMIIE